MNANRPEARHLDNKKEKCLLECKAGNRGMFASFELRLHSTVCAQDFFTTTCRQPTVHTFMWRPLPNHPLRH